MEKYGKWAGNLEGCPENKYFCTAVVYGELMISYQCQRKRGYGPDKLYCKQHAKMLKAGRRLFIPEND